jgi:uncharacterized protein with PIN domain
MKQAQVDDKQVTAGPDTPDVAACPDCGGEVNKRRRTRMDGTVTYYYRHKRGEGKDCPKRYSPT